MRANVDERRAWIFSTGCQIGIDIPELRPLPATIASLREEDIKRQATDVWNATTRLKGLIHVWTKFLGLGLVGARLNDVTEDRVISAFPELTDLAGVLNALATDVKIPSELEPEVRALDIRFHIQREPSQRHQHDNERQFRGRRLVQLIETFRKSMSTHLECLIANGLSVPFFERSGAELRTDLHLITRVDLNMTGDGCPLDFAGALGNRDACRVRDIFVRGLDTLVRLLEKYPLSALRRPMGLPARRRRSACLTKEEANVLVREHLLKEPRATRDKLAKVLGCSEGLVSGTPAWKAVAEERRKRGPGKCRGRKIGLDIADEEQAFRKYRQTRSTDQDLPTEESGCQSRPADSKAVLEKLIDEQRREGRSERRR